jgi:AcrR family transcriptional regulator
MTQSGLPQISTRDRLLDAALVVCARRGLSGATTREIADTAQVNEVTLFRHFGSKEKLFGALVQRSVTAQLETLQCVDPLDNDLRTDLRRFAAQFDNLLMTHEALIRALIGESRQHPEAARKMILEAVQPLRERLDQYLRAAQKSGAVRSELPMAQALDCFTGMLLSGMLRRTAGMQVLSYSPDEFIDTCVEIFVQGIAAPIFTPLRP